MQLDANLLRKTGIFGLVSTELAVYVCGGFFIGQFLDKKLGLTPALTALGALAGLVLAVRRIIFWYKKETGKSD